MSSKIKINGSNSKIVVGSSESSCNDHISEDEINENIEVQINDCNDNDCDDEYNFYKQSELLLERINKDHKEQKNELKNLIKLHKKEMKLMKKNKRVRKNKDKTGFTKPNVVPDKILDFLKLDKGTELSRTDLTGLLCKEFTRRNLHHNKDKRIIRPDNDVKKLFNLSKEADTSNNPKDKNGLNFYNLQTHIAKCYNDFNSNNIQSLNTPVILDNKKIQNNQNNQNNLLKKLTLNNKLN